MGVVSMVNSVMHMAGHGEVFYKVQHSDDNADGLQTQDQHAASVVCIYVVHPAICSSFYAPTTHMHCVCLLCACLLHAAGGSLGRTLSASFHLPLLMPQQIKKCIVVMLSASVLHAAGGSLGRTFSASEAHAAAEAAATAAAAGSAWGGTLPAGAAAAAQGLLASGGSWRDTVGSGGSYSGTVRSASNSRISSISTGSQALAAAAAAAAAGPAGAEGVVSNSAVGVAGSGVLGQNAAVVGAGVGAAVGAKPVYARLPSLQQLSVDVNALPVEASSAAGEATQHYIV
jgi:hypothetical protein